MGRLDGKVAVVTGGASGIGAAAARHMADEGARVCGTDIAPPGDPGGLHFVSHDVASAADWCRVREEVLTAYGQIDVLVNNAGIFRPGMILDIEPETWNRTLAVNQTGVLRGMQTFGPDFTRQEGGSIINLSSYAGMQGHGTSIAYQASKWAVRGMTRFAAREFAAAGVRVNAIMPGFIDTPMVQAAGAEFRQAITRRTPLSRLGTGQDMASAITFLASDESAFITGAELVVDGGLLA